MSIATCTCLLSVVHCDRWEHLQLGSVQTQAGKSDIHRYPYAVFHALSLSSYAAVQLEMTLFSYHFSCKFAVSNYMSQFCRMYNVG